MENGRRTMVLDRLNRRFRDRDPEKQALEKKVEKLRAHLERANNSYRVVENLHNQEESGRQQEKPSNPQELKKLNNLWRQVHEIYLREHQMGLQLSKELEMTKQQLANEKALKEMFIYKVFEADNELDRLRKRLFNNRETTDDMEIATGVHNERKQKKVIQKELGELTAAYTISQQKFSAELQVKKDQNKALQQELEQLKVSHQISRRYETELKADREENHSLQKQLEDEIQHKAERMPEELEVIKQLRAEGSALFHRMEEEIQTLRNQSQELVTKLQTEAEVSRGLRSELTKLKEEQKDETRKPAKETPTMMMDDRGDQILKRSLRIKKRNSA
ncbi:probable DNA double-strand break repair Rad50 ATPase isoform X1 [Sander lucioperca]|uniref:probable DNA double-strand break repair Rad50 ATPase isoform X1 n=1 Tax=Sander lucioperca TaxID=283035 RepID=UPI001653EBFF|nr:probable DNA double-strand break repair Rad50 ATPase isoform X1 [Sander lucioperca]